MGTTSPASTSRNLLLNSDILAPLSAHQVEFEQITGQPAVLDVTIEEARRTIGLSTRKQWSPLHRSAARHPVAHHERRSNADTNRQADDATAVKDGKLGRNCDG